jgi:hypothetical protein
LVCAGGGKWRNQDSERHSRLQSQLFFLFIKLSSGHHHSPRLARHHPQKHKPTMFLLPNLHIVDALCLFVGVLYPT